MKIKIACIVGFFEGCPLFYAIGKLKSLLKLVLIVLACVGGALLLRLHWVTAGAEESLDSFYTQSIHITNQVADILKLQDATPNYSCVKQVIDIFSGSASLVYCLLFGALFSKITNASLRSPANKPSFFILLNIGWLAMIPSNYYYYVYRSSRFDYPINADTIIIPILSGTVLVLITLLFINAFFYWFLLKKTLPVPLLVRFRNYSAFSVIAEIFFAVVLFLMLFILFHSVQSGDVTGIPIILLLLYLFISLRAAHIAQSVQSANRGQNPEILPTDC